MKTTRILAAAAAIAASTSTLSSAVAQQPGTERTNLSQNDLSVSGREAIQVLVEFEPGIEAARHSHHGEEIVYIVSGTLEYRLDGRPPVQLEAGDILFIPNGTVHAVRNVGDRRAAELATYIVEKGRPLLVPAE